jgi:hypothetical protein
LREFHQNHVICIHFVFCCEIDYYGGDSVDSSISRGWRAIEKYAMSQQTGGALNVMEDVEVKLQLKVKFCWHETQHLFSERDWKESEGHSYDVPLLLESTAETGKTPSSAEALRNAMWY